MQGLKQEIHTYLRSAVKETYRISRDFHVHSIVRSISSSFACSLLPSICMMIPSIAARGHCLLLALRMRWGLKKTAHIVTTHSLSNANPRKAEAQHSKLNSHLTLILPFLFHCYLSTCPILHFQNFPQTTCLRTLTCTRPPSFSASLPLSYHYISSTTSCTSYRCTNHIASDSLQLHHAT